MHFLFLEIVKAKIDSVSVTPLSLSRGHEAFRTSSAVVTYCCLYHK